MKHKVKKVHFVGIGGTGMCGIAEVLLNEGFQVSGSDLNHSASVARLQRLGATVHRGHAARHLDVVDVVVVSSAVADDNPEVLAARARHIPVIPRALMLVELMRFKLGIAVAGTHGKTTTTSLIASILGEAGMDPTFVIGGQLKSAASNAQLGDGAYFVAEADESDASFLHLTPVVAVVTNIDADHLGRYEQSMAKLKIAFTQFLQQLPFWGVAVMCLDDANVRDILPSISKPVVTYGLHPKSNVRASLLRADSGMMHFQVNINHAENADFAVCVNLPGVHSVQNALAAIAVAVELEVPMATIQKALLEFKGVSRRFERCGELPCDGGHFTLIDDYGHHPAEIAAVLAATRGAFVGRRVMLAFQPHRYTRTRDCFGDFVRVLSGADVLLLSEVYAAGEAEIQGANTSALCEALHHEFAGELLRVANSDELPAAILRQVRANDVVIVMGAGSIAQVAIQTKQLLGVQS